MDCLVPYSSSDSAEESEEIITAAKRTKPQLPCAKSKLGIKTKSDVNSDEERYSNAALHSNRKRTFKHERGNWATYVFIPVNENMLEGVPEVCQTELAEVVDLQICEDFHISLSRTVVLQYHLIENFAKSLEKILETELCFTLFLGELEIYVNEEKSRTFIGYKVNSTNLLNLLQKVDKVMESYRLKRFYEVPSFHVSFAWCLGDKLDAIEKWKSSLDLKNLKNISKSIDVKELRCKIGHKIYFFKLNKIL